jgi:hypothetical protein
MNGVPQKVKGSTSIDCLLRTFMQNLKRYGIVAVRSGVVVLQHDWNRRNVISLIEPLTHSSILRSNSTLDRQPE